MVPEFLLTRFIVCVLAAAAAAAAAAVCVCVYTCVCVCVCVCVSVCLSVGYFVYVCFRGAALCTRIEYFAQNKDERFVYYGKRLPSFLQQFLAKGGGVMVRR